MLPCVYVCVFVCVCVYKVLRVDCMCVRGVFVSVCMWQGGAFPQNTDKESLKSADSCHKGGLRVCVCMRACVCMRVCVRPFVLL